MAEKLNDVKSGVNNGGGGETSKRLHPDAGAFCSVDLERKKHGGGVGVKDAGGRRV